MRLGRTMIPSFRDLVNEGTVGFRVGERGDSRFLPRAYNQYYGPTGGFMGSHKWGDD